MAKRKTFAQSVGLGAGMALGGAAKAIPAALGLPLAAAGVAAGGIVGASKETSRIFDERVRKNIAETDARIKKMHNNTMNRIGAQELKRRHSDSFKWGQ